MNGIAGDFLEFQGAKKVLTRTMIEIGQIVEICFRPYHSKMVQLVHLAKDEGSVEVASSTWLNRLEL